MEPGLLAPWSGIIICVTLELQGGVTDPRSICDEGEPTEADAIFKTVAL